MTWSHTSIPYIIPQGLTPASLTRLQLVAECYRDAASIYLHSILECMSMKSAKANLETNDPQSDFEATPCLFNWTSLVSTSKPSAVHHCLSRVETFPLDDHCEYSALTFPLFIAGCESDTFAQRELVLRSLGKLQRNFGIGNVSRAKEVLNILWTRQDAKVQGVTGTGASTREVHWLDILEELKWELILA